MNRDELIALAEEHSIKLLAGDYAFSMEALEAFAATLSSATPAGGGLTMREAEKEAFENMFHKCRAEVSRAWWSRIWDMACKWAWENPKADAPTLRSALNGMLTQFGMDEDEWNKPTFDKARALLAASPVPAREGLTQDVVKVWPASCAELHPHTVELVVRFAQALAEKLAAAEKKYGYSDGWLSPDWMDECRAKLMEHVAKGDPRDVAAYCAFLWHHGQVTSKNGMAASPVPLSETGAQEVGTILRDLMQHASEADDHTPESFCKGVVALANRAHKALASPPPQSTLAQQVTQARAELASWSVEKRASVQLEGTDPFAPPQIDAQRHGREKDGK